MNTKRTNLITAVILVLIGVWGAWVSTSWTANIPIAFGLVLLLLHLVLNIQKKWTLLLATVLSLGFGLSLIMPAFRMLDEMNYIGVIRILIMIAVCLWASAVHFRNWKTKE